MATVVFSQAGMSAVQKGRLIADTVDIIQPDVSTALTKVGTRFGGLSCSTVHDSAHHLSISDVPLVVTDGSPLAVMQNLHSTRAAVSAVDKPEWWYT